MALRGEAGGRPSPQALATLNDQIMARHVVWGFGGQIDDGSLQVGRLSQPPGRDVHQPAPHQRPQVLGADERRVDDAPATSIHTKSLGLGFPQKERQHLEVFEMLIRKENRGIAQRRCASQTCSGSAESRNANFGSASFLLPFAADGQAERLSSKWVHTYYLLS